MNAKEQADAPIKSLDQKKLPYIILVVDEKGGAVVSSAGENKHLMALLSAFVFEDPQMLDIMVDVCTMLVMEKVGAKFEVLKAREQGKLN